MLLMLFVGFGMMVQMASCNTVIQTIIDEDKRGRVMAFYTISFMGTAPFGSLLAGAVASKIGAPHTILLSGIFCLIGAWMFRRELPALRKIIHPIYAKMGIIPEIASGIQAASQLTKPPED
jgi:MFS family permease